MALVLTEEQSMLREQRRAGLSATTRPVSHLRQLREQQGPPTGFLPPNLWKTFAEMGFAGLLVPEEFGGSAPSACVRGRQS